MTDRMDAKDSRPAVGDGPPGATRAQRIKERAREEFRRFVLLFVYLWLMFGLFALNERVILQQQGINFVAQGFALINALVMAKVMLVAEDLNLGRWLERRPRIYRILHDALLMTVLFIVFHILERMLVGTIHGEAAAASIPAIGGGGIGGLVCVSLILFISLIPRFAFWSISQALGPGQMRQLLFGSRNHDSGGA